MGCRLGKQSANTGDVPEVLPQQQIAVSKSEKAESSSHTAAYIEKVDDQKNEKRESEEHPRSEYLYMDQEKVRNEVEGQEGRMPSAGISEPDERAVGLAGGSADNHAALAVKPQQALVHDPLVINKRKEEIASNEQPIKEKAKKRNQRHRRRTIERRTRPLMMDPEDDTLFEIPLRMPEIDLSNELKAAV